MTDARISYAYFGIEPAFATVSELRDALLASYPGVSFFGSPVAAIPRGRDHDTAPAWGWLGQLLRTRTDWWPAAGIALQHATQDGGDHARIALADLLVSCEESVVLVEWTEPLANQWPDVRTSGAKGYAWRDEELGTIVAQQRAQWTERQNPKISLWGPDGEAMVAEVNTAADLERYLAISATTGSKRPWSWLGAVLLCHAWMRPVIPAICARFAAGTDLQVRAVLDWFAEDHDLWRYLELLEGWSRSPPAWWNDSVKVSRGRRNPLRRELAPEASTLGDVALRALSCARHQVATPPTAGGIAPREPAAIPPAIVSPVAPREPTVAPSPPAVAPQPITLTRASFDGDGVKPPTPAQRFAEHHAQIVRLLVLDRERVLSVDRDRVALLWNPRSAALIARHELPENAILPSVFTTRDDLAYLAHEPDSLVVRALGDHRVIARVAPRALTADPLALCTADLSRVLIANGGELVLISVGDGTVLARASVSSPYYEPKILSMHETGRAFLVRFFHVAMDTYPTKAQTLFDSSTLVELARIPGGIEPLAPLSQLHAARVEILGAVARLTIASNRPLPDLAAHVRPICVTEWCVDEALLTADTGGTIHRWDLDLSAPLVPTQHAAAISSVRFTKHGVVSFTAADTKLWRDEALVATLPGLTTPLIDEEAQRLIDVAPTTIRAYSLANGASLGAHAAAPGAPLVGSRGLISVGLDDAFPNRMVSLRGDRERALPMSLNGILSRTAPPIIHAGRLLLTQYTAPTRSLDLDTLAVRAECTLHEHGTSWTALHRDGVTLYSTGYADGQVAAWTFLTLANRKRWSVFSDDDRAIKTAVLLAKRDQVLVAGKTRIRRLALDQGIVARLLVPPADCAVTSEVDELVADAAERRVVVFAERAAPKVIDVDSMTWVTPRDGEIDAARARRSISPDTAARGFDQAFVCDHGRWLVGWSRGLRITPVSLAERSLRAPSTTRQVPNRAAVRDALVDDMRGELWLLCSDGALVRTSLLHDAPFETMATIASGATLVWVTPSVFVVRDDAGSLHYLRTSGEAICTLEAFASRGPYAVAESAAVSALSDGALRAAAIPDGAYRTLRDARTAVTATAVAIAAPFVASLHGNQVLRWHLETAACTGAWTASTTLAAIDIRSDGAVLAGEASGAVTLLR